MQRRRITKLVDPTAVADFEGQLSIGLGAVFENATTLANQAMLLNEHKAYRGQGVLGGVADEEAAKFLILLDAVRCPGGRRTQQLSNVYSHLAKGLYIKAYRWSCNTLGELRGYVESECRQYHLDGDGEGQSWICENAIVQQREEKMYVDYTYWEDTGYQWQSPKHLEDLGIVAAFPGQSRVLDVAKALHKIGISTPEALRVVGSIWQGLTIKDDFDRWTLEEKNLQTLQELNRLVPIE